MAQDPLHGVTLKVLLEVLVERYTWDGLADFVNIGCFKNDPSIKSSLKFLRRTPWARAKVEALYVGDVERVERNKRRNQKRAERRVKAAGYAEAEALETGTTTPAEPISAEPIPAEEPAPSSS